MNDCMILALHKELKMPAVSNEDTNAAANLTWTCTLSTVTSPAVNEDSLWTDTTVLSSNRLASTVCWLAVKVCCSDITLLAHNNTVLFTVFSHPLSDGGPLHGRSFSIYLCPLSFWLTLPWGVLSMYWCCPSRPCMVFLACVHLALFLALSLSPGNSLVSSRCEHSILTSLVWQCLTVPSLLQLCYEPTHLFSLLSTKPAESFSAL